jgi:hypothetical protein
MRSYKARSTQTGGFEEILEKIGDRNRQYFFDKLESVRQAELDQKTGNMYADLHHQVMADLYKSIIEKCFC